MNKLKVYAYAICKNESKYVEDYVKSMSEADGIYVLDTGSTDDTVKKLKKLGVKVKTKKLEPFRFDVVRNMSLDLVPKDADICVCTDFDEAFVPGWREKLEEVWLKEKPTKVEYLYNWSFDKYGNPGTTFYISKIHNRHDYTWYHPVHEVLKFTGEKEKSVIVPGIVLNHHQDLKKSRGSYLPLLELSVKEDPLDDRNLHYLGREYMYYHKWNKCIDTLIKHLDLKSSTWKDERAASMRFIARSYDNLKRKREAKMYYELAIKEAPYLREAYVELASLYYNEKNYEKAYELLKEASKITIKPTTYINEEFCWNYYFYDLFSVVAYYTNHLDDALANAIVANKLNPDDLRIKENIKLIEEQIKKD